MSSQPSCQDFMAEESKKCKTSLKARHWYTSESSFTSLPAVAIASGTSSKSEESKHESQEALGGPSGPGWRAGTGLRGGAVGLGGGEGLKGG